jgi:hypothetical protein
VDNASTAAAFLALIAVSDGLRLLPAGAIVVSRVLLGDWSLSKTAATNSGNTVRLITWCGPLVQPLVLRTDQHSTLSARRLLTRFRARRRRTQSLVGALRVVGTLTLLALVAGVPLLTSRSGVWGLLLGVSIVLCLCVVQTVLAVFAFRRAGETPFRALLGASRFLWPFSAPRAAEEVMTRVAMGVPALIVVDQLLKPEAFTGFARPLLFDAVVRGEETGPVAALRQHLGASRVAAILNAPPPMPDGDVYCPRCGASFYRSARVCSDCSDVELLTQTTG